MRTIHSDTASTGKHPLGTRFQFWGFGHISITSISLPYSLSEAVLSLHGRLQPCWMCPLSSASEAIPLSQVRESRHMHTNYMQTNSGTLVFFFILTDFSDSTNTNLFSGFCFRTIACPYIPHLLISLCSETTIHCSVGEPASQNAHIAPKRLPATARPWLQHLCEVAGA